jgi:glycine cleavage system H lipoate-binding protein
MKFRVIGSSKETGARMTLEFEALSKAAAERKAQQAGMAVNRVEIFREPEDQPSATDARPRGSGWFVKIVVLLAIAAAAYFSLRYRPR